MLTATFVRLSPRVASLATALLSLSVAFRHTTVGAWLFGIGAVLVVGNVVYAYLRARVNHRP